VVEFKHLDEGLTTNDSKAPSHFELSEDGKNFVSVAAKVVDNTVQIKLQDGMKANYIRMGWEEKAIPNLSDKNGWPVFAFPSRRIQGSSSEEVYLSDLNPDFASQDHDKLMRDKSITGNPLSIGGQIYKKGLGVHANSIVEYWLGGGYESFSANIGADDNCSGTVTFKVLCDGEVRFESPLIKKGMKAVPVNVSLTGVELLQLIVGDGGNGIGCDHANWANAKIK
jgi:hypothetical protein